MPILSTFSVIRKWVATLQLAAALAVLGGTVSFAASAKFYCGNSYAVPAVVVVSGVINHQIMVPPGGSVICELDLGFLTTVNPPTGSETFSVAAYDATTGGWINGSYNTTVFTVDTVSDYSIAMDSNVYGTMFQAVTRFPRDESPALMWLVLCASFAMGFQFMRVLRNN